MEAVPGELGACPPQLDRADVFPAGRPIGYRRRKDGCLFPDRRASKVLRAFELRREGLPQTEIARRLGWSHSTTRQILVNEVYLGVVRHGDSRKETRTPADRQPRAFDAVQATRTTSPSLPARRPATGCSGHRSSAGDAGERSRPSAGLAPTDPTSSRYYCKDAATEACPSRAYVHADELDAYIEAWFTEALRSVPRMIDVVSAGRELKEAQREAGAARARPARLLEVEPAADPTRFRHGLEARQARVTKAQERVRHLSARLNRLPVGGTLSEHWEGFDVTRRRAVLRGFLDRVEVDRGASSNLVDSVRIFWSDGSIAGDEAAIGEVAA